MVNEIICGAEILGPSALTAALNLVIGKRLAASIASSLPTFGALYFVCNSVAQGDIPGAIPPFLGALASGTVWAVTERHRNHQEDLAGEDEDKRNAIQSVLDALDEDRERRSKK